MTIPESDSSIKLPSPPPNGSTSAASREMPLRRFVVTLQPGQTEYSIAHGLGTSSVIVQTRIAGRVREGGISVPVAGTVKVVFGGVLNEPMDVVIIG
jgi:hypothetical protein